MIRHGGRTKLELPTLYLQLNAAVSETWLTSPQRQKANYLILAGVSCSPFIRKNTHRDVKTI
jgi:hypothetical protein